jgi:hypothetical protein
VSLIFDIEYLMAFADDKFIPKINKNLATLVEDMDKALEAITKWLR